MLARVAENLYWIGRYLERAESTARLLDVNYYSILEGAGLVTEQWPALLAITGSDNNFREHHARTDARSVPFWLAFDLYNPSSIRSCVTSARENARSLRDRISTEMWECVNRSYLELCFNTDAVLENDALHDYCTKVRELSHLFHGIALSTLQRDQGWQFLRVGQMIERADNLLRLLQVRYRKSRGEASVFTEALENHRWMAVLKSASAYEAYRKMNHTRLEPRTIASFLLLERSFPRSVLYSVSGMRDSLRKIPGNDALLREANWLVARLEYARIEDILIDEKPSLERLLESVQLAGRLVFETYFSAR
jgi:uncharacterized alpha-E superfamily protein